MKERKEDFLVSAETARALRLLGFPQDGETYRCGYYNPNNEYVGGAMCIWKHSNRAGEFFCAPDFYQVQRWFRSEKGISIEPFYEDGKYLCNVCLMKNGEQIGVIDSGRETTNYEEALMLGIVFSVDFCKQQIKEQ